MKTMKVKEIELLKELLKKYISDFNSETDCREKWMESVQDEIRDLLRELEQYILTNSITQINYLLYTMSIRQVTDNINVTKTN